MMELSEVFLALGEDTFQQLIRQISIGKLKTYQMYDRLKARAHTPKLNTETLRKAAPKFWARLEEGDQDFASELAQCVLIAHMDMIRNVLDFLGIPNQDGFFEKDLDASSYLTDDWQKRVWDKFHETYPHSVLQLYINHLAWELQKEPQIFAPAAA